MTTATDKRFTFTITGDVSADDDDEARSRVLRLLGILGFRDIGDGTLWLDRPSGPFDDLGMALGELTFDVTGVSISSPEVKPQMNRTEAVHVLEEGILGAFPHALAEITTAPTAEQRLAADSIRKEDIAPRLVCEAMDLDPGSTWGDVVDELRSDWGSGSAD